MDAATLLALPTSPAASGPQIFALFINFFFPSLALLVVSVRVAGRVAAHQFAADDWLVCVAMFLSIAETIISFFFIKTNFIGVPPDQVPPHDPTQGLIWAYAVQILYNPILALVKSSALIFMSRLFGQKNWVRRFLLCLNVVNLSHMVGTFFAVVLQCFPIPFNWDPTIEGGRCVDRRILYTSTAVFNIITDLLILGLPLWIFSSLKIPRRTKVALLFVFLLGFLVTITSVVRLVLLLQGLFNLAIFTSPSANVGFVTSAIETNLALITASAPALRPIFRSRDRGGWFARTVIATTRGAPDVETGQKPLNWDKAKNNSPASTRSGKPNKSNRGGSKIKPIITHVRTHDLTKLHSTSPRASQEQAMTKNGIMRVSDIQREIDGIVKDLAVAGEGSYTGGSRPGTAPKMTGVGVVGVRARPSMEIIRVGATIVTPPRPSTSGSGVGARRGVPAERYYSESIYPDQGFGDGGDDGGRASRYGERRFGVVTPRGTTPTSRGWEGSGRPF